MNLTERQKATADHYLAYFNPFTRILVLTGATHEERSRLVKDCLVPYATQEHHFCVCAVAEPYSDPVESLARQILKFLTKGFSFKTPTGQPRNINFYDLLIPQDDFVTRATTSTLYSFLPDMCAIVAKRIPHTLMVAIIPPDNRLYIDSLSLMHLLMSFYARRANVKLIVSASEDLFNAMRSLGFFELPDVAATELRKKDLS